MTASETPAAAEPALSLVPDLDLRRPDDPLHVWVSRSLERALAKGDYAVGETLPTETELCRRYRVSRNTVREALRRLADVGLIKSRAGAGTIVISTIPPAVFAYRSSSKQGLFNEPRDTTHRRVESCAVVPIDEVTARLIQSEPGKEWYRLLCTRRSDDGHVPLCWLEFLVEPSIAQRIDWRRFERNVTVRDLIRREVGVPTARIDVRITASTIHGAQAELLDVSPGAAGMLMVRRMFDPSGWNFLTLVSVHPEHRSTIELTFETEDPMVSSPSLLGATTGPGVD